MARTGTRSRGEARSGFSTRKYEIRDSATAISERQQLLGRRAEANCPAKQHEDRPVPEIERIRDQPDRHRDAAAQNLSDDRQRLPPLQTG